MSQLERRRTILTFPDVVRLKVRAAEWDRTVAWGPVVPAWHVAPYLWVQNRLIRGPGRELDVACTESLDVLVYTPSGCGDVRAYYQTRHGTIVATSAWSPVALVEAARHDPNQGRICPDLFPTIRFGGVEYVIPDPK